ncbi:MAG: tyrosine-type recombinase/integrase [Clostridia bacterium]|nr:tyrosine-type recombinase/integrase [Clostridia bacterium]
MPITKTGRTKNGLTQYRVRVNYTDINGEYRRIERLIYGKSEAAALEKQLMTEARETTTSPGRRTLAELADEYANSQRHDLRETSQFKSSSTIRQAVLPTLGSIRVDRLTTPILQKWKNDIGELDLSLTTKRNYYKYFNALLNYAVKQEYIARNPLQKVGNFKDANNLQNTTQLRYYTAEEYQRFAAAALEQAQKKNTIAEWGFYVFFSIAFYTGMRKGEINALRWSDIDGNIIRIRRSIAQKLQGGDRETGPKNKSSIRDLQAPQPLLQILADQQRRQQAANLWSLSARVCGADECLRDSSIEIHNQRYAKAAGLPHLRIHDFRHTHATLLINEGINIQEVARRLGHSDVQMTWGTYAHLYPREEERALAVLEKIV